MKTRLILIATMALMSNVVFAQSGDAEKFEIGVGGSFAKPKIIPKLEKLAIAQATIDYKLTSTVKTIGQEKRTGAMAGARVTAFLETTDGPLVDADFQEVSDHFYSYFQRKLKENGIDTVAWSTITATDFYKSGADKPDKEKEDNKGEKGGNVWVTSSAHQGNVLYSGGIAFAFGKIKKASHFCEDIGAPAAFFNLTVDFADVLVDVDIKTSSGDSYMISKTRTFKYNAAVKSEMKVIPTTQGSASLFWNEKSQSESLILRKDITAGIPYHDTINQDDSRLQKNFARLWAFRKEMNPVVIQTTREKYKAAAKKALENYADAFIAKSKENKKS